LDGESGRQRAINLSATTLWRTVLAARRVVAAGFLLLLLVIPYSSGLIVLAERENPTCGMQCCKRSGSCCCRKSAGIAHSDGPGWSASSRCAEGCRQLPVLPRVATASLVSSRIEVDPVAPLLRVSMPPASSCGSADTGFALFERPPPAI
jgi:hypothetical protein